MKMLNCSKCGLTITDAQEECPKCRTKICDIKEELEKETEKIKGGKVQKKNAKKTIEKLSAKVETVEDKNPKNKKDEMIEAITQAEVAGINETTEELSAEAEEEMLAAIVEAEALAAIEEEKAEALADVVEEDEEVEVLADVVKEDEEVEALADVVEEDAVVEALADVVEEDAVVEGLADVVEEDEVVEALADVVEEDEVVENHLCETCMTPVDEGQNFCQLCGLAVEEVEEIIHPVIPKTDEESNKLIAAVGYIFFFFPILCGYYRKSAFAKFHAKQATLLFISSTALFLGLIVFRNILDRLFITSEQYANPTSSSIMLFNSSWHHGHWTGGLFYWYLTGMVYVLHLMPFALMIVGMINAVQAKKRHLPIIGRFVKKEGAE